MEKIQRNSWIVIASATLTHLFLGTVYAWSFFQDKIALQMNWTQSESVWAFSLSILFLGLSAAWFGPRTDKYGLWQLAVIGTILYATGFIISGIALHCKWLWLLYLGFGLVGGTGLGMAYVTPVSAVSALSTKKNGLLTGLVVMGFGLGALVMSKILAPAIMEWTGDNLAYTFIIIGSSLLIIQPVIAYQLRYSKEGKKNVTVLAKELKTSLQQPSYYRLFTMFALNITAGMVFISFQSPMYERLLLGTSFNFSLLAEGSTLIAASAIFNGLGRLFWGYYGDKIGAIKAFRQIFMFQLALFTILILTKNPLVFFLSVCFVLWCYGGGFGILPSLIKSQYGSRLMTSVYGITLLGWSFGGIIGPQLVALLQDYMPLEAQRFALIVSGAFITLGFILSLRLQEGLKTGTHSTV